MRADGRPIRRIILRKMRKSCLAHAPVSSLAHASRERSQLLLAFTSSFPLIASTVCPLFERLGGGSSISESFNWWSTFGVKLVDTAVKSGSDMEEMDCVQHVGDMYVDGVGVRKSGQYVRLEMRVVK